MTVELDIDPEDLRCVIELMRTDLGDGDVDSPRNWVLSYFTERVEEAIGKSTPEQQGHGLKVSSPPDHPMRLLINRMYAIAARHARDIYGDEVEIRADGLHQVEKVDDTQMKTIFSGLDGPNMVVYEWKPNRTIEQLLLETP